MSGGISEVALRRELDQEPRPLDAVVDSAAAVGGAVPGEVEHAQRIAGHASPKTTKLYDRTADTITLDEIERIVI